MVVMLLILKHSRVDTDDKMCKCFACDYSVYWSGNLKLQIN